jgi:hypothetical protein
MEERQIALFFPREDQAAVACMGRGAEGEMEQAAAVDLMAIAPFAHAREPVAEGCLETQGVQLPICLEALAAEDNFPEMMEGLEMRLILVQVV